MHLRVNQCKELDKTKVTDNIKTLNVPGYCCWHLRCCQVMHMIFTRYGRDGTNAFDGFWLSYPCCNYQKSSIWEKLSTVALCTQSSPRAMYFLRVVSFSFFSLADFIRPYANTAITIQAGITFFTQLYSLNITFLSAKHETAAVNSLFKVNRIVTMEGGEYIHALRLYRSKIPVRTPLLHEGESAAKVDQRPLIRRSQVATLIEYIQIQPPRKRKKLTTCHDAYGFRFKPLESVCLESRKGDWSF